MRTLLATMALACCLAGTAWAQAPAAVTVPTHMVVNLTGSSFQAASQIDAGIAGAGVNGPQHAQVGLAVNLNKSNWWNTSAAVGEVDGVYSTIYQGGPGSDSSAYLGQVNATGLGFADVLEGTVTIQPPITTGNGLVDAMLDVQLGMINVGRQIYGANANLSLKPSTAPAVGYSLNGSGWDYLAQWWNNGALEYTVDGAGDVSAAGAIQAGVVPTASLPTKCLVGRQMYASDGRKPNEAAGSGSGVPVICTLARKGGASEWASLFSGAPVAN